MKSPFIFSLFRPLSADGVRYKKLCYAGGKQRVKLKDLPFVAR